MQCLEPLVALSNYFQSNARTLTEMSTNSDIINNLSLCTSKQVENISKYVEILKEREKGGERDVS